MAKKKKNNYSTDLTPLITLGALGVGGYFIWKKFFKEEEEEKTGFQIISPQLPTNAIVGETINAIIVGKNYENESHLCFIKLVDQETGELLAPRQEYNVGANLSQQFTFEFLMPNKLSLRLNMHAGRIINNEEKVDKTDVWTISSEEGYPKQICRDPYCFDVNNSIEETQMNEFLGIVPQGMDLDSYLASSTQEQLDYWKNYWVDIWTQLHRTDIVDFVKNKYNEYADLARIISTTFTKI